MKANFIYYGTELEAVRQYVSEIGLLEGDSEIAKYYFDYHGYADSLREAGVAFEHYRINGEAVTVLNFEALIGY